MGEDFFSDALEQLRNRDRGNQGNFHCRLRQGSGPFNPKFAEAMAALMNEYGVSAVLACIDAPKEETFDA